MATCVLTCANGLFWNADKFSAPGLPVNIFADNALSIETPCLTSELANAAEPGLIIPAFSNCCGLCANCPIAATGPVAVLTIPLPADIAAAAGPVCATAATWLTIVAVTFLSSVPPIAPVPGTVAAAAALTGTSGVDGTKLLVDATALEGALGKLASAELLTFTSTP